MGNGVTSIHLTFRCALRLSPKVREIEGLLFQRDKKARDDGRRPGAMARQDRDRRGAVQRIACSGCWQQLWNLLSIQPFFAFHGFDLCQSRRRRFSITTSAIPPNTATDART